MGKQRLRRITVAECSVCRTSITASPPFLTASVRQLRVECTSTPSTSSSLGIAPSPGLAFNRIVVVRYRMY
jgi:hypothetical protein